MTSLDDLSVLRQKLDRAPAPVSQAGSGADRFWRVALARAARDAIALGLDVKSLTQSRASLSELLEMPTDRALLSVLEGPSEGLGLMAVSAPLLAAMTEMQTIGRVSAMAPSLRKPTRTDAAMVAGFVDAALAGLETSLVGDADLFWAGGFRYASFLEDPRPLGLLLEDIVYRVIVAEISVEGGLRSGQILMALPAEGRGVHPPAVPGGISDAQARQMFSAELVGQVESVHCVLQAVIHRMSCPLSAVMALNVGDMLPLGQATIDKVGFEGLDGQQIAEGQLGQNRGMRAVRLVPPAQPAAALEKPIDSTVQPAKDGCDTLNAR